MTNPLPGHRDIQFHILAIFKTYTSCRAHKWTILGKPFQSGDLERFYGKEFTIEERAVAKRAFERLVDAELLLADGNDLVDPDNWLCLTHAGISALENHCLDKLDCALNDLHPHLVELRDGASSALESNRPNAAQQAANSARELIDQTLHYLAPDDEIRTQSWFKSDSTSRNGVTRRQRVKLGFQKRHPQASAEKCKHVEKTTDYVVSLADSIIQETHSRTEPSNHKVRECVDSIEAVLRQLLVD